MKAFLTNIRISFYNFREDDKFWPQPDREGRQELEIVLGNEHICFTVNPPLFYFHFIILLFFKTSKIGSLVNVQQSQDPEGLKVFYYLVQDLKSMVISLISAHFKIKPI